jgi:nucleoside-diphosphate-sugar epimerase
VFSSPEQLDGSARPSFPSSSADRVAQPLALAAGGVRSAIVRLAPSVHGDGDHRFMATLVRVARDKGVSAYVGDGTNRWPAVHRLDAARLFLLALVTAPAGSTLHAVADEGVQLRAVAEVIGRHLDLPVAPISPGDAQEHFSFLAGLLALDNPASSALTRELVGWQPTYPGLLDDLDQGHYFHNQSALAGGGPDQSVVNGAADQHIIDAPLEGDQVLLTGQ